jgi:hypothetical protein
MALPVGKPVFKFVKSNSCKDPDLWKAGTGTYIGKFHHGKLTCEHPTSHEAMDSWLSWHDLVEQAPRRATHNQMLSRYVVMARRKYPEDGKRAAAHYLPLQYFLANHAVDTELWRFRTSRESWFALAGREGYVILRGDRIVDIHITALS